MAFTISVAPVASTSPGSASTFTTLSLVGCTAGNAVVFGVEMGHPSATVTSATLTGESAGTMIGTAPYNGGSSNGDSKVQLGYFQNLAASGTKTLTVNFSVSVNNYGLWAMEVAGGMTSLADTNSGWHAEGNGAAGTTPTLGLTTDSDGDLIIGIVSGGTGTDPVAGSGDTVVPIAQFGMRHAGQYVLNAGSHGSPTKTMTIGSSDEWVFAVAAFRWQAAAAAGSQPKRLMMMGIGN